MTATAIPFRKKLALNLFKTYRRNAAKLHELNYVLWEATLRCNLSCLHCGSDCKMDTSVGDMPADDFLRVMDQVAEVANSNSTMVVFTGGEPLLRNDLEQVGLSLYRKGFPWGIVTNGMLLSKQRIDSLVDSGLRSVTVSLDGLEASHNWLRGSGMSFSRALEAVRLLCAVPDVRFDVVTCVNRRNFGELNKLLELLLQVGVKEWRIFTIFPIGRASRIPELQLQPEEFKQLFDFISWTRKENKIKLNYGCEGFLGSYEGEVRDSLFFCRAGINIASILANGSISACPNMRDNFIQGNIYKDNFRNVWEQRFLTFRDRSWTRTGACADCDFYGYCEGNGMHLRNEQNGELLFCHLQRILEGERILSGKA
ncbi:MAG TPA: TIGR04133 family radical SAM/SPASM protein [Tenuifilaceae bacterium]|nr:TIGR04133 family radical SAM/SPASM protein [Tenuifilaceae bacterium]